MIDQFDAEDTLNARIVSLSGDAFITNLIGSSLVVYWEGVNPASSNHEWFNVSVKHFTLKERLAYVSNGITLLQRLLYLEIRAPTKTINSFRNGGKITRFLEENLMYSLNNNGLTTHYPISENMGEEEGFYLFRLSIHYQFHTQLGVSSYG